MGGKILIPAKGMDHRHNARQIAFVGIPLPKRLMGNFKEHIVVGSLAKLEVPPKLGWGMEDNVFVGGIGKKELKFLLPAFGLGDPARGAEPGFTGVEDFFLRPARRALPEVKAHRLSTAVEHFVDVFGNCRTFEQGRYPLN
jgi:hypothetical protein